MALTEYRRKRDFKRTPEPRGGASRSLSKLVFVVQKHAATRLHYDFRLELDGVLKSWAVPKGPDLDPSVKRLAMQVEDHPLEYGGFEGVIPKGEYGGGTVLLWDKGTWEPVDDGGKGLREGRLKFILHGQKLRGQWMLVRRGGKRSEPGEKHWFLFKEADEYAEPGADITEQMPKSVATGRDLDQIAAKADRVWGPDGEVKATARVRKAVAATNAKRAATAAKGRLSKAPIEVAGVRLSHPDKLLFPGITKIDLAQYYEIVADWMLPHIADRPLALLRCPGGSGKPCFFQKHPGNTPTTNFRLVDVSKDGKPEYHMSVVDVSGLIALAQNGVLEIHAWGSKARSLEKPDRLVFDLDPDPELEWGRVVVAAQEIRVFLEELGLKSFLKTTGGKGLHLVVPIQARTPWEQAKEFCRMAAELIVKAAPNRYVATMTKAARKGKIYIDYHRNSRGATAVAAYSTRVNPGATVSVPVAWDELSPRLRSDYFTLRNLPARLKDLKKDPWEAIFKTRQSLTASLLKRLQNL